MVGGAMNVKRSADEVVEMPNGVPTVTRTAPEPGKSVTTIWLSVSLKIVDPLKPKLT